MNYIVLIGRKLIVGLLILQNLSTLQAVTQSNYAEMGLALATIPFDITAQKHTLAKNTKKAALYHMAAHSLSIANKILYLHNNINAQQINGRLNLTNRDILVNCSIALLDLKNLFKYFRVLVPAPQKVNPVATEDLLDFDFDNDTDDLLDFEFEEDEAVQEEIFDEAEADAEAEIAEEKISRLVKTWRTVALPSLKGLTAFALACAQQNATSYENYSRTQARNMLTAAHSLTKLLAEYSALESNTGYPKLLIAAMMLNATWLAYEIKRYIETMPEPFRMQTSQGHCEVCIEDDVEINHLRCGHGYCRDCLAGTINARYGDRGAQPFNRTPCPHQGCQEVISRDEMAIIMNNDRTIMDAYDEAQARFGRPAMSPLSDAEIRAQGFKRCPNQACRRTIEKGNACRHVICTCGHQFCWWCLRDWPHYYYNDCGNQNPGQNPHDRHQRWDINDPMW
ncbi:hypothetical protein JST56_06980 [Candidatus Dependentiae bacterium]|jgi:hypothetical protein|nr:hypothetical protein [Candidatus Dependentiae bacterium]